MPAIEIQHLRKQYGGFTAVDGLSFSAEAGEIFGLLGPNGAGKSTTIGCITGLVEPSAGAISIQGLDIHRQGPQARRKLGVAPQEIALYEDLAAVENLRYWGAAYGLRGSDLKRRVEQVLEDIGLTDRAQDPPKQFSGGMKRRLNFGCAIVHTPQVLLLDEPTVGVDPQSREHLLDLVRRQAEAGTCVIYTTHYMEEAERLCQHLLIIDGGKIIAAGTLADLQAQLGEGDMLVLRGTFDPAKIYRAFPETGAIRCFSVATDSIQLAVPNATRDLPHVFTTLDKAGAQISETTISRPNLESLFIKLTGKELRK
ncbi:MAG: ATP-binding cassette domain-containing protein [Candidatus Latescibacteria bacterium]|nr:ATP-binding cassette domain-containing protein [Candidatus Latescibacterota bacterium]